MSLLPSCRGALYAGVKKRLAAAGGDTPELDARLLLAAACDIDDVALIAEPEMLVPATALSRLEVMVERRLAGEPVSRILGCREFWGLAFHLNSATLDPRPDSETIIEAVLRVAGDTTAPLHILDLGTGTGCLLLALLSEYKQAQGLGVDVSETAIDAADENAVRLGLAGRASFVQGDWANGLTGHYDVIVSNPPYIPSADIDRLSPEVRQFDPVTALDGGADGLDPYRHLMPEIRRLLAPEGFGVLEFGEGQGADIAAIARMAGLTVCGLHSDLAGLERVIIVKP